MERLLQGLLALSVLLACNHPVSVAAAEAAVNGTSAGDLVQDISNSLCTANYQTVIPKINDYCAQDDVPPSECGEYLFGDVTLIYCSMDETLDLSSTMGVFTANRRFL